MHYWEQNEMALMEKGKSVVSTPSPREYFQSRVPTVQSPNRPIASMETSLVEDQRIALEDKHNACAASTAMGPQSQVTQGSVKRAKAKAINNPYAKPHTAQKNGSKWKRRRTRKLQMRRTERPSLPSKQRNELTWERKSAKNALRERAVTTPMILHARKVSTTNRVWKRSPRCLLSRARQYLQA